MMNTGLIPLALILAPLGMTWAQATRAPLPPETDMSHDGWYAEMPAALAEAKRTGKDMLIDFGGSDWCAPCRWLKQRILVKPEFIDRASKQFVLVDIDTLSRGLSPDRKARYVALQKQYKVTTFPSVFLATPEGKPYAWTTYIPPKGHDAAGLAAAAQLDTPERFWAQLQPLIANGKVFRDGLAKADAMKGEGKADVLVDAMAHVRPDFLELYYPERIAELKQLDASDRHGFLAYLAGVKAYNDLETKIGGGYGLKPDVKVTDVDALIAKYALKGETLQQALAMKATLLVIDGKPREALGAIEGFVAAQSSRSSFDRGDYMLVTPETITTLKKRIAEGTAEEGGAAQYLALHRIFEGQELPNRYKVSCHATETSAFEPMVAVRSFIGEAYGRELLASTASLQGEARAKALGKGLEGTYFAGPGAINTIINEIIPSLVGAENTASYLPASYKAFVRPRQP